MGGDVDAEGVVAGMLQAGPQEIHGFPSHFDGWYMD